MANVKNAAIREIVIDRMLHSRKGYTIQQIMNACNDALEMQGCRLITSPNTIHNDFLNISNRWCQVIESERHGRFLYYRYRDSEFSIFNSPLSEEEIIKVNEALEVMQRFKGQDGFAWVDDFSAHMAATMNMGKTPGSIISYDDNALLKGMVHFAPLHEAIRACQPIIVEYRPYNNPELLKETIHPYFLKQYNSRWFVLGYNKKYDAITTFALDRIISISNAETVKFIPNKKYNFEEYFKNVIGVTVYAQDAEEVQIMVKKSLYPYISSKPLHPSQKLVRLTEDGDAVISIKVIPNYELKQLVLSYGERMTILSPQHLREEICEQMQKIMENYK